MGHQRRLDVGGMSAIAPIATKMLRRDERRKGPGRDIRQIFTCRGLAQVNPRTSPTVQQPLEVKASELVISVLPNMRGKGSHRSGIAGFQLGKRFEITPCRGTFVLLPSEGFESTQSFRPTSQH